MRAARSKNVLSRDDAAAYELAELMRKAAQDMAQEAQDDNISQLGMQEHLIKTISRMLKITDHTEYSNVIITYDDFGFDPVHLSSVLIPGANFNGLPLSVVIKAFANLQESGRQTTKRRAKVESRPTKLRVGPDLTTARLLAAYEVLQKVDLTDSSFSEAERVRLAGNVALTHERLRKRGVNPGTSDTLRAARRLLKARYRQRQRAKLKM